MICCVSLFILFTLSASLAHSPHSPHSSHSQVIKPRRLSPPIKSGEHWHPRLLRRNFSHAEGISLWDPITFRQDSLCAKWCTLLATDNPQQQCNAIIFRAPPLSGKTSFGSLMAFHATSRYGGVRAYLVRGHASEADRVVHRYTFICSLLWSTARRIWDPVPQSVQDVLQDPADNYGHLVVIDEAQHLYVPTDIVEQRKDWTRDAPYPLNLWARVKQLAQRNVSSRVKVLVLAAFGLVFIHHCCTFVSHSRRMDLQQVSGSLCALIRDRRSISHQCSCPQPNFGCTWIHTSATPGDLLHLLVCRRSPESSYPTVIREMLWRLTRGHIGVYSPKALCAYLNSLFEPAAVVFAAVCPCWARPGSV